LGSANLFEVILGSTTSKKVEKHWNTVMKEREGEREIG
jgi:hypothetical protein